MLLAVAVGDRRQQQLPCKERVALVLRVLAGLWACSLQHRDQLTFIALGFPFKPRQQHHIEAETLGFVNGHQLHTEALADARIR